MRHPLGVRRLDEVLKGGLPERSAVLLYGPPFVGKEVLSRSAVLANLRQGLPAILFLTDASAADVRAEMTRIDEKFPSYEKAGLVRYIDSYSKSIGVADSHPLVQYVDGLLNLNAVSLAVNAAQRELIRQHSNHLLVMESVSTLIAYANAATAFRFLQVLLGKTKAAGAADLILLEQGMHADAEVQMIKHLVDGVIELRADADKHLLRIEGLGASDQRSWVEYKHQEGGIELTGSFAAGRIR